MLYPTPYVISCITRESLSEAEGKLPDAFAACLPPYHIFLSHSLTPKGKRKKMDTLKGTFNDLKNQIVNAEAIQTSNVVFRMHYVFTVTGLVTASVLLSLGQVTFFLNLDSPNQS